jgi:hypothetical protein
MKVRIQKFNLKRLGLVSALVLGMSACGSDDDTAPASPPPPVNTAPVITLNVASFEEKAEASIVATVEDDGQISSYAWEQFAGPTVTLAYTDTDTVSFTAPSVLSDETISLRLTVTDDEGATNSADINIEILSISISVTLNGLVTDGPIANANVSIEAGGETITTTADENGAYSATVSIDDDLGNSLVTATASGPRENSIIKLKSLLGSANQLVAIAGEDGRLGVDELFSVNVTNVSTANVIVLEIANNGAIETLEQLANAEVASDSSLILPFATAIKLVIDYAASNPSLGLPEGVLNTLELVSNAEIASAYLSNAQTNAPEIYQEAQDAILNNENLVNSNIDADAIVGKFYLISPEGAFGGGRQLNFEASGMGQDITIIQIGQESGSQSFTWENTTDGVLAKYVDPLVFVSFPFDPEYGDPLNGQIEQNSKTVSANYKVIAESANSLQLGIQYTTLFSYPNSERPDEETESSSVITAVKSSGVQSAANFLEMGVEYAIPIPNGVYRKDFTSPLYGEMSFSIENWYALAEFSGSVAAGGEVKIKTPDYAADGATSFDESIANWTINTQGEIVIVDGEETLTLTTLNVGDGITPVISARFEDSNSASAESGRMLYPQDAWNSENAPGIYALDWSFLFDRNDRFWLEINADGTGLQVSTSDNNGDGEITGNEISVWPTLWEFAHDGSISMRRYTSKNRRFNRCIPDSFSPPPLDDCSVLFNDRGLALYAIKEVNSETRFHTLNIHKFYNLGLPFNLPGFPEFPEYPERLLQSIYSAERHWLKLDERPINIDDALTNVFEPNSVDTKLLKANKPQVLDMR